MITALTLMLSAPVAIAQTAPPRVDPGYLDYLDNLGQFDDLPFDTNPQPELTEGIWGLFDLQAGNMGAIFATGTSPFVNEAWFMPGPVDPGEGFAFRYEGILDQGQTEAGVLNAKYGGAWQNGTCFDQDLVYKTKPAVAKTGSLTYDNGVDHYHFGLLQDGQVAARLLREHHHVANMPEMYIDHWAFYDGFYFPDQVGATMWVLPTQIQFDNTASFYADLHLNDHIWFGFAQVTYTEEPAVQCL